MRVNPVAQPEFDYDLPASESEDWRFSATVAVEPKPSPPTGRSSRCRSTRPTCRGGRHRELEALQRSVAELIPSRPSARRATPWSSTCSPRTDRPADYVVELGSERLVEEIENASTGLSAGESREVAYELADGSRRTATVVVKEVKERVLPPLDDELAKTATEFETLDELRADIEGRLRAQIDDELEGAFRAAAVRDDIGQRPNVERGLGRFDAQHLQQCSRRLVGVDAGILEQLMHRHIENARGVVGTLYVATALILRRSPRSICR